MQRLYYLLITFLVLTFGFACKSTPNNPWTSFIPENTSFIYTPDGNITIEDFSKLEFVDLLDDITASVIPQFSSFIQSSEVDLTLQAILVYPATSTQSQIIWITKTPDNINDWITDYYKLLHQNYYNFNGITIYKVSDFGTDIFVTQINDWLLFSDSSFALENSLRAYTGVDTPLDITDKFDENSLLTNLPELDKWVQQFSNIEYRPSLQRSFYGTKAGVLDFKKLGSKDEPAFHLSGEFALSEDSTSLLIGAFAKNNEVIYLDRFISSNAAAFAIMNLEPQSYPKEIKDTDLTPLDSLLSSSQSTFDAISNTLDSQFAYEVFPESGLSAIGENLFMRKVKNTDRLNIELENLASKNYLTASGNSYLATGKLLAQLIGSEMSSFENYYITLVDDVVAIAKRKGLAESVAADVNRRRVIYYNDDYAELRDSFPSTMSGFFFAKSKDFEKFLRPYLMPHNVSSSLFNQFDIITIVARNKDEDTFTLDISTAVMKGSNQPYQELWVTPLNDSNLSGTPVRGDIVGSSTEEIIYATDAGEVFALAVDGTLVMQASTDSTKPVGSPLLYDWYGNNQPVIMLAAGTKIYAWNHSGTLLPRFPMDLEADITAPITIADVSRNGIPEIIVATNDRKLHVLDRRGNNIKGWPKSLNASITSKPIFEVIDGQYSVWAFAQNVLHAWDSFGDERENYPQFINAGFNGSPVKYKDNILGASVDGYMYSFGQNPIFEDTLSTTIKTGDIGIQSVYVSNSDLLTIGVEHNVRLSHEEKGAITTDLITTQSRNGSVFLFSNKGELLVNHNLGQPASDTYHPAIMDINSSGTKDIIALAEFGRLFVWDINSGERLYDIPTSGMSHPLIADLNNNGRIEIVAQTRDGLRCWTIYEPRN